jgi:TonB family protein
MMKHNDPKNPKRKNFLRIPTFPGGKEAYLKFIKENVVYPQQALTNKTEGLVFIRYTVDNIGDIVEVEVTKGIGNGCDEEAIRVIRLLKYEPARNRGVRMTVEMKTRIQFQLPQNVKNNDQTGLQLNYSTSEQDKTNNPEPTSRAVYNYTINLG